MLFLGYFSFLAPVILSLLACILSVLTSRNDRSVWSYLTGRAAAMAPIDEPSDGDIQNFIDYTGAPQSRAIQYLKVGTKSKSSCNGHTDVAPGSQ